MRPANAPLCLIPGTTNRSTLRVMQPTWIYKPVTAIEATAPVRLTVPDHGLTITGPGTIDAAKIITL